MYVVYCILCFIEILEALSSISVTTSMKTIMSTTVGVGSYFSGSCNTTTARFMRTVSLANPVTTGMTLPQPKQGNPLCNNFSYIHKYIPATVYEHKCFKFFLPA